MPFDDSSFSNCSLLTKSRRTWSCRSCRQSMRTAPRMWFLSYAAVSSSTSTSTTLGSSRCASTQSASTRTLLLGICLLLYLCRFGSGDVTNDGPPEHTDQSKMDLATEAEVERSVEERRGQRERRRHDAERSEAGEITDGTDDREPEADALREPRRRLRLQLGRRGQPRRDEASVDHAVRRVAQAGERADAEHDRLRGEQPSARRDQHSGEYDGGDGRAETRTPRVDIHIAELLGKTRKVAASTSGGQTQAGRYAAQVDRAPAPQPGFHTRTLRNVCCDCNRGFAVAHQLQQQQCNNSGEGARPRSVGGYVRGLAPPSMARDPVVPPSRPVAE